MKRRINNLYKGMFKGNKTSNIIELHSKRNQNENQPLKSSLQNIDLNQFNYNNLNNNLNEVNNNINSNSNNNNKNKNISKNTKNKNTKSFKKNIENNDKVKLISLLKNDNSLKEEDFFSDSDQSSNQKSKIMTKIYNKHAKKLGFGSYFNRLRQQVIDKFISGQPIIKIDKMYDNPEVKKVFGIVTDNYIKNEFTENKNINSASNEFDSNENIDIENQRDRRIPPSKFVPYMNNNIKCDNSTTINNINNNNDFQMNNNNEYNPKMLNDLMDIDDHIYIRNNNNNYYKNDNINNNMINTMNNNMINAMNNNMFNAMNNNMFNNNRNIGNNLDTNENYISYFQGENRIKRNVNEEQNRENYMINFNNRNEVNFPIYNITNEVDDINNVINNLKNANNNEFNVFVNNNNNDSLYNEMFNKNNNRQYYNYYQKNPNFMDNNQNLNPNMMNYNTPPKNK